MAGTDGQLIERARAFMQTPEFAKLWRYASVSVISTVLSLSLLFLFFNVAGIASATWSNFLATSITSVPAYYLNRTWAWGKTGKSHIMREVVPFWIIAIVSILLSTGAVHIASREAHDITHSHGVITVVVLLANFFTYAVLWVVKFILFNRVLFKKHPDADDSGLGGSQGGRSKTIAHTSPNRIGSAQAFSRLLPRTL